MHLICCSRKFPTTSRTPLYFRSRAGSQYCDHTQPKEIVIHFSSQMGFQFDYLLFQNFIGLLQSERISKKKKQQHHQWTRLMINNIFVLEILVYILEKRENVKFLFPFGKHCLLFRELIFSACKQGLHKLWESVGVRRHWGPARVNSDKWHGIIWNRDSV